MKRFFKIVPIFFFGFTRTGFADPSAIGQKEFISQDFNSIIGIKLRSNFNDISRCLGQAPVTRLQTGDWDSMSIGDQDSMSTCYSSNQADDRTMLIFFGSAEHGISSFTVLSSKAAAKETGRHCASSSKVSKDVQTPNHLRIGMDRHLLLQLLGDPKWDKGDFIEWAIQGQKKFSEEEKLRSKKQNVQSVQDAFEYRILVTMQDGKTKSFSVTDVVPAYDDDD